MVGLVTTIPWFRSQPRVVGSNGCRWLLPSWHLAAIWQLPPMQAELEVRPESRTQREPISASQHLVDVAQPLVGRKGPMPPRLFDANHSVLVLARGAPITKTEEWQEDGQERRTGTETSGGGFPLVQQPLWFHPWLVLVWDDEFSLIAITVWMALGKVSKKPDLFGTWSQTSDPTHPPRTFGTKS